MWESVNGRRAEEFHLRDALRGTKILAIPSLLRS
jgi:hypothetical protein